MNPWTYCFICLGLSFFFLFQELKDAGVSLGIAGHQRKLQKVTVLLRELEETLQAGLLPPSEQWDSLKSLSPPWGKLSHQSIQSLRNSGGSLTPTLKRLRELAEHHSATLEEARAKSSQAFAQCFICFLLAPLLGVALYLLIPEIEQNQRTWIFACFLSLCWTSVGGLWLLQMSENARWGGLPAPRRKWTLLAECSGEQFLALLRSGTPPDLAWTQACQGLTEEAPDLSLLWGNSIWDSSPHLLKNRAEQILNSFGSSLKKAIHLSLMEGRPCTDRVESALMSLRQTMKAQVERELSLLSTRALKPLFICIAPALLGLLLFGIWLASSDALDGAFDAF